MHRRSTSYDRYTDDRNYGRTPPNQLRRNPPYKMYERHHQRRHEPNYYRHERDHYQQPQHYRHDPSYTINRNENVATNYSYFDGFDSMKPTQYDRECEPMQPTHYSRHSRRKRQCYSPTPSPPIPAQKYPYYDQERHRFENTNNSRKQTSEYSEMKSELFSLKSQIEELNALKAINNNSNNNTNNNTNNAMAAELNSLKTQIETLKSLKQTQSRTNSVNYNENPVKKTKKLQNRIDSMLHWIISQQTCAQRKIESSFKLTKDEIIIVLNILCKEKYVRENNGKYYLNPKYKKKNFIYNNTKYLQKLQKRFGIFFNQNRKIRKTDKLRAPPPKKQKILEIENNVIANSLISINNENNANNDDENNGNDNNENNVSSLDDLFSTQRRAEIQQQGPPPPPPRPSPPAPRPKSPDMVQYEQRLDILRSPTNNTVLATTSDSYEPSQSDLSESSQRSELSQSDRDLFDVTDSDSDSYRSLTESDVHSDGSLASTLSIHSSDNDQAYPNNTK